MESGRQNIGSKEHMKEEQRNNGEVEQGKIKRELE